MTRDGWTTGERFSAAFLSPAPYVSWIALSLSLAISGPFGTYAACSFVQRLWCFSVLTGLCLLYGIGARAALQSVFTTLTFWRASLIVIGASLFILPVPLIYLMARLTTLRPTALPSQIETAAIVLVFGLATAAIRWTMARESVVPASAAQASFMGAARPADAVAATDDAQPVPPRLFSRLSAADAGQLIRLSARNHYVDVVTDKGTSSLLIRMSDAIAELDGVDGLRVHRSHWVAARAVRGHERKGDKRLLILADGARIPVSRNLQRDVAARGFL